MSIPSLQKAAAVLAAGVPDADQSLALSRAVGITLAMATPLQNLNDPVMDTMTRAELINIINNKKEVYAAIDTCNECVLLCVDTTVRTFTRAFLYRLETARGTPASLTFAAQFDPCIVECVELLYPELRQLLNP